MSSVTYLSVISMHNTVSWRRMAVNGELGRTSQKIVTVF